MKLSATLARPTKAVLASLTLVAITGLMIGWTAGTVAASSGTRAASATATPHAADLLYASGAQAPTTQSGANGATTSEGGSSSSIMYPVSGYNSLGVAPQGTILAEGTGTAEMKADGSDQAAALKKATDAALADAHTQALAAATAMGVALKDVYSTSIQTSTNYTYPTTDCVGIPVTPDNQKGATSSSGGGVISPQAECAAPTTTAATSAQMVVTLIVAYTFA
jgi:hypothetical protein